MAGRFCVIVALLMFSAVVIHSTPAQAAEPAASARAPDPSVAEHLRRATSARLGKRWAEAADAYRAAYELEPRPEIAGELGVCLERLRRHREAAEMLLVSLEDPAALPEEQRRRFAQAQQQAEQEVTAAAISANPATAEVLIDGRSLGPPLGTYLVYLEPGPHELRARLAGYDDAVAHLDARAGTTERISLLLREPPPPLKPSPRPAPACRPGADCSGKVIGTLRLVGFAAAGAALAAGAGMAIAAEALDMQRGELAAGRATDTCRRQGSPELCSDLTELRSTRDTLAGGATGGQLAPPSSALPLPGGRTAGDGREPRQGVDAPGVEVLAGLKYGQEHLLDDVMGVRRIDAPRAQVPEEELDPGLGHRPAERGVRFLRGGVVGAHMSGIRVGQAGSFENRQLPLVLLTTRTSSRPRARRRSARAHRRSPRRRRRPAALR